MSHRFLVLNASLCVIMAEHSRETTLVTGTVHCLCPQTVVIKLEDARLTLTLSCTL